MPHPRRARAWLALILAPGLGPNRLVALDNQLDSLSGWSDLSSDQLRACGLGAEQIDALHHPRQDWLDRAMDWLDAPRHFLITRDDELYPPLLKTIADPPIALFVAGRPELLVQPQVAIVGSRNATSGGLEHARDFSRTLTRAGFTITSGLAMGIDSAAHESCLAAGGSTVAITGTGPDQIYPARNKALARDIVEQGAMASPFPPGTQPRPGNFPARNRIISGMSLGTLVVEAGLRSGSLITARLASEQGREIFAIPGSVHNPQARGCHRLIRDGARLVETADEVVEALLPLAGELAQQIESLLSSANRERLDNGDAPPHVEEDPDYRRLLDAIGFDPTPVDEIILRSELTTAAVSSMLLIMELDGRIAAHPGGRYSRTGARPAEKDRSE
ncbi:hypothetical protein AY599_01795 [Leptolyngbya valderiana BDU 20041]|nr:hypothetical protein AY599_01795 [Leptolyngbya valderiana BDU 20041]